MTFEFDPHLLARAEQMVTQWANHVARRANCTAGCGQHAGLVDLRAVTSQSCAVTCGTFDDRGGGPRRRGRLMSSKAAALQTNSASLAQCSLCVPRGDGLLSRGLIQWPNSAYLSRDY